MAISAVFSLRIPRAGNMASEFLIAQAIINHLPNVLGLKASPYRN